MELKSWILRRELVRANIPAAARKVLDVTRMKRALDGWTPPTSLRDGLKKTIAWYRANKAEADAKW